MGDLRTIKADGHSPFTRYTNLLLYTTQNLRHFVERDREAIELLSAPMALKIACQRAEKWYWARRGAEKHQNTFFKFPRIWTRRDERAVVAMLQAKAQEGSMSSEEEVAIASEMVQIAYEPDRRCSRIISFLTRSHSKLIGDVIQELTSSGKIATLGPIIESARIEFQQICDHARLAADICDGSDDHHSKMCDASDRLEQIISNWLAWLPDPRKSDQHSIQPEISIQIPQGEKSEDELPKSKRAESPARVKAKVACEYAMERIPDATQMTVVELWNAIKKNREVAEFVPGTPDTFRRYLNDCGIKLKKGSFKSPGRSVIRQSDI